MRQKLLGTPARAGLTIGGALLVLGHVAGWTTYGIDCKFEDCKLPVDLMHFLVKTFDISPEKAMKVAQQYTPEQVWAMTVAATSTGAAIVGGVSAAIAKACCFAEKGRMRVVGRTDVAEEGQPLNLQGNEPTYSSMPQS
jgi:hypothetical protein